MSKIDWKQIAKDHDMDYHEFGTELINTTMAYMSNEMERHNSNEMEISKDNINIKLICRINNDK